ncbi:AAA family ATPase [Bacillus sp. 1P06AnD]|uniref:AAA family ATPase n=1 Tax=Bacillus sp. 1P06AnD TaxID=3132208 RepID=UPI00399FD196
MRISSITLSHKKKETSSYPFTIPLIRSLSSLAFSSPVTFFAGENGSGKSTILEALAVAVQSTTIGSQSAAADPTLFHVRPLAERLNITWEDRKQRGFFLRSEDFFNFVKEQNKLRAELLANIAEVEETYQSRSILAKNLALSPYANSLSQMEARYGKDLDAQSHGESFLNVLSSRVVPNGLYLLDEPEAALSPMRQLTLIAMIKDAVMEGSQFIMATHSPILLAYSGATIYEFEGSAIHPKKYDDLEHVTFTKSFLANPEQFLRHL